MTKINACHLASGDLWAGAEVQIYNIIKGQNSSKNNKTYAILMNKGKLYDELRKLNINILLVNEKNLSLLKQILLIRKFVKKNDIRIIHSHRYKENIFASIISISFFRKIFLIKTQHGSIMHSRGYRMKAYRAIDLLCSIDFFDKIIAVSNDISKQFQNYISRHKIDVVHNSICFNDYRIKEKKMRQNHKLTVAVIGRLVKIKNIYEFITIITASIEKGINISGIIVGDGPERKSLELYVQNKGVKNNIKFLGYIDDISEIYNKIDILLITSTHEGIPTVMLEAMYLKKFVIAKNVGGISEVIKNLKNGLVYNSVNHGVQILSDLSKNILKLKKIQENARKTVELKYSHYVQAAKYERIYDSVAKKANIFK